MSTWHLLLRAANLGSRNKIAMADLRRILTDLGHEDVKTVLNSGNARFVSGKRSAKALADEIEAALDRELGLKLRACVRSNDAMAAALDGVPADLKGYLVITFLFDKPKPAALREVLDRDWSPEVVRGNDEVLYIAYSPGGAHSSKLQNGVLEKLLGVGCTARTPATVAKMLA
jgi:uncharacterized protein (DUF1697 family)